MFGKKERTHSEECQGTIVRFWRNTGDVVGLVEVAYEVDGVEYRIKESLKVKSEVIKFGPIPVGQRTYSVLKNANEGEKVAVCYDPHNPSQAFIRDNRGKRNI